MNQVIKIKSQDIPEGSKQSPVGQAWALVKTSAKSEFKSVKLPILVGSSTDCDILVNAPTLRAISKVVVAVGDELRMSDAQTYQPVDLSDLSIFGIEIWGPFQDNPQSLSPLKRMLRIFQIREQNFYRSKYPSILKKYLPEVQALRLGVLGLLFLFLMVGIYFAPDSSQTVVDLSHKPIPVKVGNIASTSVKSLGVNSSYALGATFKIASVKRSNQDNYTLTLTLTGLDIDRELVILFNDKLIGTTQAQLNCVEATCAVDFPVSSSVIEDGENFIKVIHEAPESSYAIKYVFFRNMEPATSEDIETCKQLIASASRFFDERHLLVQNIRMAKDAINDAETIISTKTGLDDLVSRFKHVKKQVDIAFKETSDDLKFRVEKEIQLGHKKQALAILNDMLKLYPNPASTQYNFLSQQRKKLQEEE